METCNTHNDEHIITGRISRVTLTRENVLEIVIDADFEFDIEDAQEVLDATKFLANGRTLPHLYLIGARTLPSKSARQLSSSKKGSKYKSAEAIVVNTLSQKMIYNFMINVEKTAVPTKLFNNEADAREWLDAQ